MIVCLKKLFIITLTLCFISLPIYADKFTDVSSDHWAYEAVDELTSKGYMDGYLDGTFKGRRVITRYELSIILAKMLSKLESVERTGGSIPDRDITLFDKLSSEFRDELNALGIRVENLENKVESIENKQNEKPKLAITGFYEASMRYVEDPSTTVDDPKNYSGQDSTDKRDYTGFDTLYQDIYLKFLGTPYDSVEVYTELKATIYGNSEHREWYTDNRSDLSRYPTMFDYDNYMKVNTNVVHMKYSHPRFNLRAFANESITPLTNPFRLNTSKSWIYGPFNGLEINGSINDFSYFAFHYKELDDRNEVHPDYELDNTDTIGLRLNYVVPQKYMKKSELIFGATFMEYMKDYKTIGNFNDISALDLTYKNNNYGNFSLAMEVLRSNDGIDGVDDNEQKIIKGYAHKLDTSYHLNTWDFSINYWDLGRDFRIRTWDKYNFYSDGADPGENFFKFKTRYDYDNQPRERDFQGEGVMQFTWQDSILGEVNDFDNQLEEYYSLESWIDWTLKTRQRTKISLHKDARPTEVGTSKLEMELTNKSFNDKVDSRMYAFLERDGDEENLQGNDETDYGVEGDISVSVTKDIFVKLWMNYLVERDNFTLLNVDPEKLTSNSDKEDNTQEDRSEYYLETKLNFHPRVSYTGKWWERFERSPSYEELATDTRWFINELKFDLSPKLKVKTVYWWKKIINSIDTYDKGDRQNMYGEIIYDATDKTKIKLIYGDWISYNKDDRPEDDSSSVRNVADIETEKKFLFEASTDF